MAPTTPSRAAPHCSGTTRILANSATSSANHVLHPVHPAWIGLEKLSRWRCWRYRRCRCCRRCGRRRGKWSGDEQNSGQAVRVRPERIGSVGTGRNFVTAQRPNATSTGLGPDRDDLVAGQVDTDAFAGFHRNSTVITQSSRNDVGGSQYDAIGRVVVDKNDLRSHRGSAKGQSKKCQQAGADCARMMQRDGHKSRRSGS